MGSGPTAAGVVPRTGVPPGLSTEDRFAQVIETLPVVLVLAEPGGRIEIVNRRAERMFGYAGGELRGKRLELLVAERFRDRIDLEDRFLTNVSSTPTGQGWDLFGLRRDGTEFPLEIDLNPIDLDGRPRLLASLIDITARRQHERDTEERQRELERSNADLEEFAYAASHDLRAPLRAIANLAQWIGEDLGATASPAALESLDLLKGRVVRLQVLLDGLLNYSRIGRAAKVEDVDVAEVLRDIVAILAPPAGFVVCWDADLPIVRTHRPPLQVVLENLIGNALKHHDREEGRITVALRAEEGVAECRVSDDGPGIPPRFHERIFVIFETLASRDDVESAGIGLALAKKQVRQHGGQIRVESAPPARGTSFVFTWKESAP